eukprot:jgi/Picsp_1/1537/NSC_05015-R1_---NA---
MKSATSSEGCLGCKSSPLLVAMLLVLYIIAQNTTKFTEFKNKGGPIDLTGSLYADGYIGLITPSGFTSSVYLGDGVYQMQMGRYLSWECTGNEGEYTATVLRRDIYSNGTVFTKEHCEIGLIQAPDSYYWISSEEECPDPETVDFSSTQRDTFLLNSSILPAPNFANLTCSTGADPSGLDTSDGPGLNLKDAEIGEQYLGSMVPPPLEGNSTFPPVFSYPGITSEVHGIWEIPTANSFRTIAGDGFSIVTYDAEKNIFQQALGRYNSYTCLNSSTPGYRSSASQSSFNESGVVYFGTGAGCSAGVFLDPEVKEVSIAGGLESCPEPDPNARLNVLLERYPDDSVDGSSVACLRRQDDGEGNSPSSGIVSKHPLVPVRMIYILYSVLLGLYPLLL